MLTELIVRFVLSAGAIVVAGVFLARASDSIAELTGLGRLLAGSILLAGATSLPEILVDVSAVRRGMPDLAVGDLMGSSLANLMILAIADLLHRGSRRVFSQASGAHALSGAMSLNLATIAAIAIFLGSRFPGAALGEIGFGPLLIAVSYLLGVRLVYYDQRLHAPAARQGAGARAGKRKVLAKRFMVFGACTVAVLVSAPVLAETAGQIAEITGLGSTFIGTTLVALCTSLPELVSTLAAVRMGAIDLAIGNIFGSNSFNMLILVFLDLAHDGQLLAVVSRSHVLTALGTILATSVAIMGQLYQVERRKKLIEPDALVIIAIALGALFLLYHQAAGAEGTEGAGGAARQGVGRKQPLADHAIAWRRAVAIAPALRAGVGLPNGRSQDRGVPWHSGPRSDNCSSFSP